MRAWVAGFLGISTVAGLAMPALADVRMTAVQTLIFPAQVTEFDNVARDFGLFDSNLGTLLSVNIYDAFSEHSLISITNSSPGTSYGTANTTSNFMLSAADSGQTAVIQALLGTRSAIGATGNYSAGSGQTAVVQSDSGLVTSNGYQTTTAPTDLLAFEQVGGGGGTILANTITTTNVVYSGGNSSASQLTTGSGQFRIYYTYASAAAVPELDSWAMLVTGFGIVGATQRRRTVKRAAA